MIDLERLLATMAAVKTIDSKPIIDIILSCEACRYLENLPKVENSNYNIMGIPVLSSLFLPTNMVIVRYKDNTRLLGYDCKIIKLEGENENSA